MSRVRKYKWEETYGDVGPKVSGLEKRHYDTQLRAKKARLPVNH